MKTIKRRSESFSFYNHTGIEAHLTKMAKKGWMIESITNLCWTYRKIDPQDIHFCVSYYPRASDFDPEPTEEQQTFHDFCAHTGWKLACTWFQMQIFYNEQNSPIPLDTDPIMEVDTLHRACKKNFLPSCYLLLSLGLVMVVLSIVRFFEDPIGFLSSSSQLLAGYAYFSLFILASLELITYFAWYKKAKAAAQDGIFVDTPSNTIVQKVIAGLLLIAMIVWLFDLFSMNNPVFAWIAIAMLVSMFGIIIVVNCIKLGLKKANASRGLNKALTFAACFFLPLMIIGLITYIGLSAATSNLYENNPFDDSAMPLSVLDFYEVDEDNYIGQNIIYETFLVGQRRVSMFGDWSIEGADELPDLWYTVTTVKVPFLYDLCKEQMFRDSDETDNGIPEGHRRIYKEIDATPWVANVAYRLYSEEDGWENTYLICYDNKIVRIIFGWEPTSADMGIVGQKLNP